MRAHPSWSEVRRTAIRSTAIVFAGSVLWLGAAPVFAQVPVMIVEEPSRSFSIQTRARLAPPINRQVIRDLLSEAGLTTSSAPPTLFYLTPREPYREPGGYLVMYGINTPTYHIPYWSPKHPDPTGAVHLTDRHAVLVYLSRLKPTTRYVLDLSIDAMNATNLEIWTCDRPGSRRLLATPVSAGPQHAFIAAVTNSGGGACHELRSAGVDIITLLRVDVSEIGPFFPTRLP